ncbi:MAG: acireductone synthase [Phycisphaerales bacterium]|nr:acireductone synthase [Phycisphaerales bacterium]
MSDTRVVLLDIEGTIAPIAFVHETLFPFARERLSDFLARHWDEPAVREARTQIARDAGEGEFSIEPLVEHLSALMDADVKATGLKMLQGLIWEGGFRDGVLKSPLFEDVPPALRRWNGEGRRVCIYSSGSIAAQRLFIAHTEHGDLSPLIDGNFDTTTGPKREAASYAQIARHLETAAADIVFASDVVEELNAAASAGMQTRLAIRPGNPTQPASDHLAIRRFDDV